MGQREQEFFNKESFVVVGNTRRMRDAVQGLKMLGKTVYFVDPGFSENKVEGKFASLTDLPGAVEGAIMDGKPDLLKAYLAACSIAGVGSVWINYQSDKPEVVHLAAEKGLDVLSGQCAVVWLPTKGPHHFMHRKLWKLFGKY